MAGGDNCEQCREHSGQLAKAEANKEAIGLLNGQLIAIVSGQHEIRETMAKFAGDMTSRVDYMEEKVDKMDHLTEAVLRLGIAVESSNAAIEQSNAENKVTLAKVLEILTKHETVMDGHATEIEALKLVPAKQALKLQDYIKGLFLAVFAGGIMTLLWEKAVSIWSK